MDFSLLVIAACAVLAVALVVVFLVYGRSEGTFKFDIGGSAPRAAGGSDESAEKTFSSRLVGLAVAVGGVFTVLLGRLWSMQLVSSDEYAQQAESNRTRTVYTSAPRGRILDRNGEEIVGNRPSLTVVAESSVLDDEVEMQLLASLLGMPCQAVRRKIQDSSEGAQSARTVCVDVSRRVVAFIGEHPALFPGVSVQQRTQRSYPYGTLAAHVVGYTGTLTSDQLKASQESSSGVTYRSGDVVGQTGVESRYESVLQGVRGETTVYVDSSGTVLEESTSIAPQSGSDLFLTLDLNVQKAAEESLEKVIMQMRDKGYPASSGSVVAVDCTNGEVIAMASYPTYSPNMFVGGNATQAGNGFLPEAHTDFVFALYAEQFGFVGCVVLLGLFAWMIFATILLAMRIDAPFGKLVLVGCAALWTFQVLENVGMCIGIMPITGIPLPFISFGSSSMLTQLICVGIVQSVWRHRQKAA